VIYWLIGILVVAALALWFVTKGIGRKHALDKSVKQKVAEAWDIIEQIMQEDNESAHARAVVDADKLLDFVLKKKNIPGETMGDRLKNGSNYFKDVDSVWRAHKVRNQIAHEINMKITRTQAKQTLDLFKKSLRDLGAL